MKLIDLENIDFVILEDSLNRIEHKKGDEIDCVIGAQEVKAIPIPDGATNGDIIKIMFPSCEQKECLNNEYFEMYFDNDLGNTSYMRVSKKWWNAEYKEPKTDIRECGSCKHSKDGHIADTEECHTCMWESKQEPKTECEQDHAILQAYSDETI